MKHYFHTIIIQILQTIMALYDSVTKNKSILLKTNKCNNKTRIQFIILLFINYNIQISKIIIYISYM